MTENRALSPKLGWVHQVHTQNPGCTHRPRALCPSSAHTAPCCRPGPAVSQAWAVVSPLARARPCVVSQRLPWPCHVRITTQPTAKPLPHCHNTINCIMTRPQPNCPLVTIQRLYRDTIPLTASPRACHDTPIRIPTQSLSHSNRMP